MQQNNLQQYFPMIRTRNAVLDEIKGSGVLLKKYNGWKKKQQEEFLDFVTGARGVKMLYDSFFKEVLNPETVPERLNAFLTLLLGREVQIVSVLAPDNSRLGDETSLVIMDIIVRLEDRSIVDVEVQKIGYRFPGQRSACYSADMLLRQYKAARDAQKEKKEHFSYYDIHDVYTIVFFESSPEKFQEHPDIYLHHFEQKSDSGLELELLQKYLFIPLDIFRKNLQNRGIRDKVDAWLTFLSCDEPEIIARLIEQYPEFRSMYEHIYDVCRNTEKVMGMYSEELRILDRNTAMLMVDEMKDAIQGHKKTIEMLEANTKKLEEVKQTLEAENQTLEATRQTLEAENQTLEATKQTLEAENQSLEAENQTLEATKQTLEAENQSLEATNQSLEATNQSLEATNQSLEAENQSLEATNQSLESDKKFLTASVRVWRLRSLGKSTEEIIRATGLSAEDIKKITDAQD